MFHYLRVFLLNIEKSFSDIEIIYYGDIFLSPVKLIILEKNIEIILISLKPNENIYHNMQ